MMKVIDRRKIFVLYDNLEVVIEHLKRIKQIKAYLNKKT